MIYLDNSATTQPCPACVRAMTEALTDCWGNPSSVYALGIDAAHRLRQARQAVAAALGAEPDRVFFTSGGTEADNWAILSAAERLGKRGRHIVTTAVEHHAVLHPMQKLEAKGFEVTYLQPDHDGNITVEELKKALRPDTILVSVMMVNNETGAVMPIADMVKAVRRSAPLALFHTDAVQGFLKVPFQRQSARRGHDLRLRAQDPRPPRARARSISVPACPSPRSSTAADRRATTAPARKICPASAASAQPAPARTQRRTLRAWRSCAIWPGKSWLEIDGLVLIGSAGRAAHRQPRPCPASVHRALSTVCSQTGIYVSAGSACSKGHRSHVLEAMHLSPAVIDGSIRVSFSRDNTEADVDALCQALLHAKQTLKG